MKGLSSQTVGGATLRVLEYVMRENAEGRNPSLLDICTALGRTVNAVSQARDRLLRHGLVTWTNGKARTLRATCYFMAMR